MKPNSNLRCQRGDHFAQLNVVTFSTDEKGMVYCCRKIIFQMYESRLRGGVFSHLNLLLPRQICQCVSLIPFRAICRSFFKQFANDLHTSVSDTAERLSDPQTITRNIQGLHPSKAGFEGQLNYYAVRRPVQYTQIPRVPEMRPNVS